MPVETIISNGTQILQPIIYKQLPFYANGWFWLGVVMLLFGSVFFIYRNIIDKIKNRLVIRVHLLNGYVEHHIFKQFPGEKFTIPGHEQLIEGQRIPFNYVFKPECIEKGRWGSYIDYDYGNPIPIFPVKRQYDRLQDLQLFKVLSALTNSEMLSNLLSSKEFKKFVVMMLWIIAIEGFLIFISVIVFKFVIKEPQQACLGFNNQTAMFLKQVTTQKVSIPI